MAVHIRYMGAKHKLAPTVVDLISQLPDGPCLDLFAGMCSVAGALAVKGREAWCNDIQKYAYVVAKALITTQALPPVTPDKIANISTYFKRNQRSLEGRFSDSLENEEEALDCDHYRRYQELMDTCLHVGNDSKLEAEARILQKNSKTFPYRLVTITYSYGYFGLRQAIQLDSLRYALDQSVENGIISQDEYLWALVAVMQTASQLVSAPGHFAQFLRIKDQATYQRIRHLRKKSIWERFLVELARLKPYGTREWRAKNRTFFEDAQVLASNLGEMRVPPRVVYADPPYSEAQYSRYYHVLESLAEYDYPVTTGIGRYRGNRFQTPFSMKSTVSEAFRSLVKDVAMSNAALVISYPSNGLLYQTGENLESMLRECFASVDVVRIDYRHSTLGGAHGRMHMNVEENIFVAQNHTPN